MAGQNFSPNEGPDIPLIPPNVLVVPTVQIVSRRWREFLLPGISILFFLGYLSNALPINYYYSLLRPAAGKLRYLQAHFPGASFYCSHSISINGVTGVEGLGKDFCSVESVIYWPCACVRPINYTFLTIPKFVVCLTLCPFRAFVRTLYRNNPA